MSLQAIAYSSQATTGLSVHDMEAVALRAANRNLQAGVSGILLYDGSHFLQYLEGPDESLSTVYSRILTSRRHHEIIELKRGRVGVRRFPQHALQLLHVEPLVLRAAASSDWTGFTRRRSDAARPTGIDQLAALVAPQLDVLG